MKSFRSVLVASLLAFACGAGAQSAPTKSYIVQLRDAPVATFDGGVSGLAPTRPAEGTKLDAMAPNVLAYVNFLDIRRSAALAAVSDIVVTHTYNFAFAGFAAVMTEEQAAALKQSANVAMVVEDADPAARHDQHAAVPGHQRTRRHLVARRRQRPCGQGRKRHHRHDRQRRLARRTRPSATRSTVPAIRLRIPGGHLRLRYVRLPSGRAPARRARDLPASMCNNKLIGARFYHAGFDSNPAAVRTSFEYLSPRDGDGHGTHTSSTAGGNSSVECERSSGVSAGVMSGIAPRARIATYKVCWEATITANTGCYNSDTLSAIDDAVTDGVDVINFSISGTQTMFRDPVEIAYLNASRRRCLRCGFRRQ